MFLLDAFSTSFDHWKGLDIVFNNVGSVKETEQMSIINTNVVGILHGTLLGLKYMSKANGGNGGVIINTSGIYGIDPVFLSPANSATRNFVNTLGRTLGHPLYYSYNCVRIITLCPGHTDTELLSRAQIVNAISDALAPGLKDIAVQILESILLQPVKSVALAAMVILKNGPNGSVWVVEDGQMPYEITFPNRKEMAKRS
ncbi:hypothetical protein RI129_010556 [Pyrocoelia pectoralis]|uniref:Alcohol dehydrogenase n=1 Tax=Pyrocoelia pectoralis TaxID=417401 RepID=A0AAN7UYV1_9COLE